MLVVLEVITVIVVSVAMALSLAHALEWPGKMRLTREQYLAVQPIYYPGFTFGGMAEPLGLVLTVVLSVAMPSGASRWLTIGAALSVAAMHASYWLLTHPVNNFWLRDVEMKRAGKGFFAIDPLRQTDGGQADWTVLRDRWELSHLVRAVLGVLGLVLLVTAVALRPGTP